MVKKVVQWWESWLEVLPQPFAKKNLIEDPLSFIVNMALKAHKFLGFLKGEINLDVFIVKLLEKLWIVIMVLLNRDFSNSTYIRSMVLSWLSLKSQL